MLSQSIFECLGVGGGWDITNNTYFWTVDDHCWKQDARLGESVS